MPCKFDFTVLTVSAVFKPVKYVNDLPHVDNAADPVGAAVAPFTLIWGVYVIPFTVLLIVVIFPDLIL